MSRYKLIFLLSLFSIAAFGQTKPCKDSVPVVNQRDIIDILRKVIHHPSLFNDTILKEKGKVYYSLFPVAGYTLYTRFAATVAANATFYTDDIIKSNLSVISTSPTYTQNLQIIVPLESSIWTKGNKYNIQGDWKYFKYPQSTFGLGGRSLIKNADSMQFQYIVIHETFLKHIARDFFVGAGYYLDYHWDITEQGLHTVETDFEKYGKTTSSTSSGIVLNGLYDVRRNAVNPPKGFYANIIYRDNFKFMGSDNNWQSLTADVRKYFKPGPCSNNVLAFWGYAWIILKGNPPYLDLPATGWDQYANMARGYIQSRFKGKKLLYLESEYRFGITHNGLLGGVVFANVQNVSRTVSTRLSLLHPAVGTGIRIKFNKHSNTNLCIDYGLSPDGGGFFVNLGEVF